jgi:hypothetical protein
MLNNNTEISQGIKNTIEEFKKIGINRKIPEPEKTLKITTIPDEIARKIRLQNQDVLITRKALEHIIERRGVKADEFIGSIPDVLNNPTKIGDNSAKRANSYLFAKMNGKAKGVVLEVIKKPEENQVVSCYFIDKKTYNKLVDISGRSDVPPSIPQ